MRIFFSNNFFLLIIFTADIFAFIIYQFSISSAIFYKNFTLFLLIIISFIKIRFIFKNILIIFFFLLIFICLVHNLLFLNTSNFQLLFQSLFLIIYPMLIFNYAANISQNLFSYISFLKKFVYINTIFMIIEIFFTDFIISLDVKGFFNLVKSVYTGLNPISGFPANWHINFPDVYPRRGAGLLMAPLASGMISAFVSLIILHEYTQKRIISLISLLLPCFGLILSQSRGPILFFIIGSIIILNSIKNKSLFLKENYFMLLLLFSLTIFYIFPFLENRFTFDSSAKGHLQSLIFNFSNMFNIPILGYGIGTQGAIIARENIETVGGGEGAIFSLMFQTGLIITFIFVIWLFTLCFRVENTDYKGLNKIILISSIPIIFTSEHLYTITGFIFIWVFIGINRH